MIVLIISNHLLNKK